MEAHSTNRKSCTPLSQRKELSMRQILEAACDGFWDWDYQTDRVNINAGRFSMLDDEPREPTPFHETWAALLHPEDKTEMQKAVQKHLDKKSDRFEAECRLRSGQGSWKWFLIRGRVVQRDAAGRPLRIVGTHHDIHKYKIQEENLISRSDFLETLLDTIPNPVFYKDAQGVYRGCNNAFSQQIIGLPREKIVGATLQDLPEAIPNDLAKVYHEKDMELIERPGCQSYETRVRCADGVRRDFLFNKATVCNRSGEVSGIVGVMLDISSVKQAERTLEDSRERLERILHSLPVGMVIIDRATKKIVEANPAAVAMIGSPVEAIVGSVCHRFICPAEEGRCPILDLGQVINNSEKELLTVSGESIPIHKTVIPANLDGRDFLLECFKDMRHLKEAENERIKAEKLQAIIEMSGSICHEMNQPLQIITGFSELLLMETEDEERNPGLVAINEQVHRLSKITNRLRNLTQYETMHYLKGRIVDLEKSSKSHPPCRKDD